MGTRALWVGPWNTRGLLPSVDSREESLGSQPTSPLTHASLGNLGATYSLGGTASWEACGEAEWMAPGHVCPEGDAARPADSSGKKWEPACEG